MNLFDNSTEFKSKFDVEVAFIKFRGLQKTKESFLYSYFSDVKKAKNLKQVDESLGETVRKIRELDLFKKIDFSFDINENRQMLISLDIEEKKNRFFQLGGAISSKKEVDVNAGYGIRNLFGIGDKSLLKLSYFGGTNISLSNELKVPKTDQLFPLKYLPELFLSDIGVLGNPLFLNFDIHSKRKLENSKCLESNITGFTIAQQIFSNTLLSYTFENRRIKNIQKEIQLNSDFLDGNFMNHFLPKSKNSQISHTYTRNLRNSDIDPTGGSFLKVQNALSENIVFGDSMFWRSEIVLRKYANLYQYLKSSISFDFGFIKPITKNKKVDYQDRLFTTIPGFRVPSERGIIKGNTSLRFATPLSFLGGLYDSTNINFHTLLTIGNTYNRNDFTSVQNFINKTNASVSAGVCLLFSFGRIDMNFNFPVTRNNREGFKKFEVNFNCDI